jgi:hypothetical protein
MLSKRRIWNLVMALFLLLPLFVATGPVPVIFAQEAPANAQFKAIVERTDLPIIQGRVSRSWLWGPGGFKTDAGETYEEGQNGRRLVQYYDKARLELTTSGRGPTSGLLAKELMTGQLQLGDNKFEQRGPSSISVAGDPDDTLAPTYADLGLLFERPAFTTTLVISTFIRPDGTQATLPSLAQYNVTYEEYAPGSRHTIASVFKNFLNSDGLVFQNGQLVQGKLFDSALFTTGLPLTEPYWTRAKIAGRVQDVLVQGFERRVMTYAPTEANAGFRVETGNVGRHYFQWRYDITEVQLLGINDFHGRLLPEVSGGVQRGGAAYVAPVINNLRNSNPRTFLIGAGDSAGATQLQSALLQDEPSVEVYNKLRFDTSSVGNHEFDKGLPEALRLLKGGKNPVRGNDWSGANFPYLVANLEYKDTGKPPLDPYVILDKDGIKVGVIGAVTNDLPTLVSPSGIASLNVLDEPTGINKYVGKLRTKALKS